MSATDGTTPVVSVCMITYNHERFIAQAIESVLMQETDFPVELVIGEDCSTDGTRAIVVEYAQRYPDRIRPLLRERNLGMIPNFVATLQACRGKYVAMLEGDDYWTDPHKLQKQVEFLEGHPECSMCFHNVALVSDSSEPVMSARYPSDYKSIWSIKDLLFCNPFTTCSALFRRGLITEFPGWFYEAPVGDWPLWVLLAQYGDAFFINQIMAVYRQHLGGHTSRYGPGKWLPEILHLYDIMDEALGFRYHNQVVAGKTMHLREYGKGLIAELATSLEPRDAILVYLDLWEQHAGDPPPNPRELLGHAFTARFFQAAKTKNYGVIRRTFWKVARYDTAQLRNRGVWSLLFEAIFGVRISSWRKQVCRTEILKSRKSFQGMRGSR